MLRRLSAAPDCGPGPNPNPLGPAERPEMAHGPGAGAAIADPVRLGLAEGDPVRCVMKCHEMS